MLNQIYCAIRYRLRIYKRDEPRFLAILGHMRGGATLLKNLMAEHPLIAGKQEFKQNYITSRDLYRLYWRIWRIEGGKAHRARYLQDKLVGLDLEIAPTILQRPATRLLFLHRQPESTLRDIMNFQPDQTYEMARDYYCGRLTVLCSLNEAARTSGTPWLALASESLFSQPPQTLARVLTFLELPALVPSTMSKQPANGRISHSGTPSPIVRSGQTLPPMPLNSTQLPPAIIDPARRAYEHYLTQLGAA
jgi:hypothetical protein